MSHKLYGTIALAALIAAGSAFAADAPPAASSAPAAAAAAPSAPVVPATPPAVSSTTAPTAAPMPSAAPAASAPAPVAEAPAPAPAPAPMAAMPAKMEKPHVSACTRAIRSAEHDLKVSKGKPEAIAGAWQHIQAAKQARAMRNKEACKSEAAAASKMSHMM